MGFFSTQKIVAGALALLISAPAGGGGSRHTTTVYLRGKAVKVGVYEPPPGAARRPFQLLVISGDLGWLGISRNVPGHMNGQGYRVVTLNAQSYVARFTGDGGREHLTDEQVAHDFDTIMEATNVDSRHPPAYASVGVSEGGGLAVIAAAKPSPGSNCRGVVVLGLPALTALGWRWTDFVSWITKKEPHEAEVENRIYLARLRVPLVVIHSIHDEYDSIDHIREILQADPAPNRLIPIDAPNHRFTHHVGEVLAHADSALDWIAGFGTAQASATDR